jgi:gamma-glutamyltranspeptidase/glutathione hydrolase
LSIDSVSTTGAEGAPVALRPTIQGTRHVVSSGHYLASQAAFEILEAGGNAVDAGIAAGLVTGVVQSEFVNVAGVAPIMIYLADRREVVTISGLGVWPRAATLDLFLDRCGGTIPNGVLRTVVPAAPDAWITALERFGTMSFGEVARAAIRFAREGFAMYPILADLLDVFQDAYRSWPQNAAIYLPNGRPPKVGELFVQSDLGRTLQYMVDQEQHVAKGNRITGLNAARDAFYRGDIAKTICDFHAREGGLMTREDMATFRVDVEAPLRYRYRGTDVYTCQPWCQGPTLIQMLAILEGIDLSDLHRAGADYAHLLLETMKLVFVDRERHYADPRHRAVPMDRLLSAAHNQSQRARIDRNRAIPYDELWAEPHASGDGKKVPSLDTSYVAVIDRHGNAFSATPSDVSYDTPVVPGTGLCPSSRGAQSWAVRGHPCAVAPGTRPRLTPAPAMAIDDTQVFAFGTPGGDVQCQAMLQVLLNVQQWGMDLQQAIEAPRVATFSFPDSFEPHTALPDRVLLEDRMGVTVETKLRDRGHDVGLWPPFTWRAGGVCAAALDKRTGIRSGAADPRRACYAVGW